MMRLKSKLLSLNAQKTVKTKVFSPRNTEELRIPFKTDKTAKVVGKLAAVPPPKITPISEEGDESVQEPTETDETEAPLVTGVLVQNDFKLSLMAPEDLLEYAGLNTTIITCKQHLVLSAAGIELIKWALEGTFGAVEELPEMRRTAIKEAHANGDDTEMSDAKDETPAAADEEVATLVAAYLVMGCVTVRYRTNGQVELEWEGNMLNDGIADSVMAVLFSVESSPAAVKRSSEKNPHSHSHDHDSKALDHTTTKNPHANVSAADRLERLLWFLEAQFGEDNVSPIETPRLPPTIKEGQNGNDDDTDMQTKEEAEDQKDEEELAQRQRKELERLHKIGIPVPGVAITVDKMAAKVWLEDLEVECSNKVFADRVKAVVERAVEVTAPLWG
jgi:cleavage and polyadenylation specificity factor subunit 3